MAPRSSQQVMLAYNADTLVAVTGPIAGALWGSRIRPRWLGRDLGEGESSVIGCSTLQPAVTLAPHAAQPRPDVHADHWLRCQRFGSRVGCCCGPPRQLKQGVLGPKPRR